MENRKAFLFFQSVLDKAAVSAVESVPQRLPLRGRILECILRLPLKGRLLISYSVMKRRTRTPSVGFVATSRKRAALGLRPLKAPAQRERRRESPFLQSSRKIKQNRMARPAACRCSPSAPQHAYTHPISRKSPNKFACLLDRIAAVAL